MRNAFVLLAAIVIFTSAIVLFNTGFAWLGETGHLLINVFLVLFMLFFLISFGDKI